MSNEKVLIIGAGAAGLSAAYELVRKRIQPIVLEKGDKVGGIARTETYKGYYFDMGGHRFFSKIETVNQLWQQMLGHNLLTVSRLSRIYYHGHFFNYPLTPFNALANLGFFESLLIVLSYIGAKAYPSPEEETFEQWVIHRFGRRLYATFFKTYTEKVWGIPCHRIQADWAAQRIKGLSLAVALSNALLRTQKAKSLISEFFYPLRGPGMMWQRFQDEIEAGGGEVKCKAEVLSVRHENRRITEVSCLHDNKVTDIPISHLISSIPLARLVDRMEPRVPDNIIAASHGLSYRAFVIVILIINQEDLFPDQWIYIHSPEVSVSRIQNFKNWSAAMVPDLNKTSIGMEYFCNEGDEVWSKSDSEMTDLASRELSKLGLVEPGCIIDSYVVRQPYAYPIYDYGYDEHLNVIRNYLHTFSNLQTIGRNGMHRYNNMDHSMQTGILAAENVLGAHRDLWLVNEEDEYLEEGENHTVEVDVPEEILTQTFSRMDKLALAIAVGSVAGVLFFLVTLWSVTESGTGVGAYLLGLLANYFTGYTVSAKGAFIAFSYGFLWGFLFGWLFAFLRNFFLTLYLYQVRKRVELLSFKDFFDSI